MKLAAYRKRVCGQFPAIGQKSGDASGSPEDLRENLKGLDGNFSDLTIAFREFMVYDKDCTKAGRNTARRCLRVEIK